jgi:hypothetical protein
MLHTCQQIIRFILAQSWTIQSGDVVALDRVVQATLPFNVLRQAQWWFVDMPEYFIGWFL